MDDDLRRRFDALPDITRLPQAPVIATTGDDAYRPFADLIAETPITIEVLAAAPGLLDLLTQAASECGWRLVRNGDRLTAIEQSSNSLA